MSIKEWPGIAYDYGKSWLADFLTKKENIQAIKTGASIPAIFGVIAAIVAVININPWVTIPTRWVRVGAALIIFAVSDYAETHFRQWKESVEEATDEDTD